MFGQYQCHRLCFSLMTFQTFLTISEAPTISIKYTSNIAWRHFTSYQFFPSDWYNLNLSQEKKYWRVNRSRRLKDQNNIAFMTPYKVQYFLWPWNRCWLNVAFVYSVWHYNRKSKTALNIALNLFWKLTVSANLLTSKICLRVNPIFTEMAYKINKTKYTVDTKS